MGRAMIPMMLGALAVLVVAGCGGGADPTATARPAATATRVPAAGTQPPAATAVPTRPLATATPTAAPTPTPPPASGIKRGGVLKQDEPGSISRSFQSPLRNPTLGGTGLPRSAGLIYQTLFQYDLYNNHKFSGVLAEGFEYAPTADQVTIRLQPKAQWSDGKPVTAQDVKWNLDHWAKPPQGYTVAGAAQTIGLSMAQAEAVDEKTLRIKLKGPDVAFVPLMGDPLAFIRPSHRTLEQTATEPLGSGAYLFKEVQPDVKLTTVKNPTYWMKDASGGSLPYLDGVENYSLVDNTRAWTALTVGQVDISAKDRATAFAGKEPEVARTMPGAYVQKVFAGQFGWQLKNTAPLNDPKFMKAMHILTDRLALVELVFNGQGVIDSVGVMSPTFSTEWSLPMKEILSAPGFRYVDKRTGEVETDMEKLAKGLSAVYQKDPKDIEIGLQLLREAGMDPAAGKLPKFSLMVARRFEEHATVISQTLSKALGVKITLEALEDAAASERGTTGQYEAYVVSLYPGNYEPSQTLVAFTTRGSGRQGFVVPELDALFDQQKAAVDPAKRREVIWAFQRKLLAGAHRILGSNNTGMGGVTREWVKGHWRIPIVSNSNTFALDRLWMEKG